MKKVLFFTLLTCLTTATVQAQSDGLTAHSLFQSNMVIQRDKAIVIWGQAPAGQEVSVSFAGQEAKGMADDKGAWRVSLPAMPANATGQVLTLKSKGKTLNFNNVLIGDIWIAGGQSNMQHPLSNVEDGPMEIASANFPNIRLLTVPPIIDHKLKKSFPLQANGEGKWITCSPKSVPGFTAIGYIFARRIHMASQVPIGMIDASRWGTTVEAWTPIAELRKLDAATVKSQLAEWDKKVADYDPQKALEARIQRYNSRTEHLKKQGQDVSKRKPPTEIPPSPLHNQNHPGTCYNSFIAPLAGFAVKGAIYHQGFNNSRFDAAQFYYTVMPVMIRAWRTTFRDPNMAFGIISLCTDGAPQTFDNFTESMLNHGILVREAQYKTFLDFYKGGDKNIGFASSYDHRHAWYHPQNKVPAGERIARWALATQYGLTRIAWKPPMVTEVKVEKDSLHIHFDNHVGPKERGAAIVGFAIAGADKKYQPARAEPLLTGKDGRGRPKYNSKILVLSSPHVPQPIHYRYAWGRNPMANLQLAHVHQKDVPLATQRSDSWTFYEVPNVRPLPEKVSDRTYYNQIREALQLVDLERRVKDAQLLLERDKPLYEEKKKKVEEQQTP